MARKIKIWKYLRAISGFNTPIFGINWNPPDDEKKVVRSLIHFFEDRRVLFVPYHLEIQSHVLTSVSEIRAKLSDSIDHLPERSPALPHVQAMRAACRNMISGEFGDFRNFQIELRLNHGEQNPAGFLVALGEFRAKFGIQIGALSAMYGISVHEELASIIPDETDIAE